MGRPAVARRHRPCRNRGLRSQLQPRRGLSNPAVGAPAAGRARRGRVADDVPFASGGRLWSRSGGLVALHDASGGVLARVLRGAGDDWVVPTPDGPYDAGGRGCSRASSAATGRARRSGSAMPGEPGLSACPRG